MSANATVVYATDFGTLISHFRRGI